MSLPDLVQLGLPIRVILRSGRVKGPTKIGPSQINNSDNNSYCADIWCFGILLIHAAGLIIKVDNDGGKDSLKWQCSD